MSDFQKDWVKLNLPTQLGNIGSEFRRILNWEEKGNNEYKLKAFERLLELLDLTIAANTKEGFVGELLRLREVCCDWVQKSKEYNVSSEILEKYFLDFALLARSSR